MKKEVFLPAGWHELTNDDLLQLAEITNQYSFANEVRVSFMIYLLGAIVHRDGTLRIDKKAIIDEAILLDLAETHLKWMFDENDNFTPNFLENPLQIHSHADIGWTGMNYGDYSTIMMYASRMKTNEAEALKAIASILYNIGPEELEKLTANEYTLIKWWHLSVLSYLARKFPKIYAQGSSDGDSSCDGAMTTNPQDIVDSQQKLIDYLASGDLTKKKVVKESPLYDALYTLQFSLERDEELAKQQQKINN